MRRQYELEDGLGARFQAATEAMIPQLVEHMIERLAQALDFSELRDQLIESFTASTELLPVVDERSEAILTSVQEEVVINKSMLTDVLRLERKLDSMAAAVSDLAGSAVPNLQDLCLDRFEDLQRYFVALYGSFTSLAFLGLSGFLNKAAKSLVFCYPPKCSQGYVEVTMMNTDVARAMPQGTGGYDRSPKGESAWQSPSPVTISPLGIIFFTFFHIKNPPWE